MKITSRKIEKLQNGGFFNSQAGQQLMSTGLNSLTNVLTNVAKNRNQNKQLKQQQQLSNAQYKQQVADLKLQKAQEAKNFADQYMAQKQQEFANGGSENASSIVANYLANQNMGNELAQLERQKREQDKAYHDQLVGNRTNTAMNTLMQLGQTAFQVGKGYRQWNNQRLENYRNQKSGAIS